MLTSVLNTPLLLLEDSSNVFYFFKVNKSVYTAKSRQRYHKTFNNILLHVSNHTLEDMYMLNYGTF